MTDLVIDVKRKTLFIILSLCLMFSVCKTVNAEEFTGIQNEKSGDLTYSITSDGHLTVEGTGN